MIFPFFKRPKKNELQCFCKILRGKQAFGMNNVKVANKGKILEGGVTLRWVYMQKFRSVSFQVEKLEKELKVFDRWRLNFRPFDG